MYRFAEGASPPHLSVNPNSGIPDLSFVICAKDEAETIRPLTDQIIEEVQRLRFRIDQVEILIIDDGSTDGTWHATLAASEDYPEAVRGIRLRRNLGKANALNIGFREARAQTVLTLDADLQDVPAEIGRFLEKLDEGWDLVVGWKRDRQDPRVKVISSSLFNWLMNRSSGLRIHDHNCGFKAMRREVIENITLYGDMHRMLALFAASHGFRVTEIPVRHHPRGHGKSKYGSYGLSRATRGFFDMITVLYLHRFGDRPSHASGFIGWQTLGVGLLLVVIGTIRDLTAGEGKLCLMLGPMLVVAGLIILNLGLMAELQLHMSKRGRNSSPITDSTPRPSAGDRQSDPVSRSERAPAKAQAD